MASKPIRRLVLLRHAKSAWPDLPDHDRPLAGRGRGDAPVMGRWLQDTGCIPDLVWCSTAERATQTWRLAAAELGADPPVSYEPRLYGATAGELANLIRQAPPRTTTLLLVGHNPGIQDLALTLSATTADDTAVASENTASENTVGENAAVAGENTAGGNTAGGNTAAAGENTAGGNTAGEDTAGRTATREDPAAALLDRAAIKFPTAAIAVLEFGGDWPDLSTGSARLVTFVVPRELGR